MAVQARQVAALSAAGGDIPRDSVLLGAAPG